MLAFGSSVFLLMSFPPMLEAIAQSLSLSHTREGSLMSVVYLAAIGLAIPMGSVVDRSDLRRMALVGVGLLFPGALLCSAPVYEVVLAGRFVVGLGGITTNLVAGAAIGRYFSGRRLGLAMGVFHTLFPVVTLVNFLFVRDAAATFGWSRVVLGTSLASLVALAAVLLLWRKDVPAQGSPATQGEAYRIYTGSGPPAVGTWATTRNLLFVVLIIGWFGFCAAGSIILTFGAAWLAEASDFRSADLTMALLMVGVLPGSPLLGRLADILGDRALVLVGSALVGVLTHLAFTLRIGPPWLVVLAMGLLFAGGVPSATYSLVAEMYPGQRLATAFGVLLTFSNIGSLVGPIVAGWLRDRSDSHFGGMLVMSGMSGLILLSSLVFLLLKRKMRAAWPQPGTQPENN